MAGVVRDGKVSLEKPKVSLYVRLGIDPNDAATKDDKFQLSSTDGGSYQQTKTVRDDLVKGDRCVDLIFTGIRPDLKYSLKIDPGKEGEPYFIFEDLPYREIAELFGEEQERPEDESQEEEEEDELKGWGEWIEDWAK